jgi:hypothetical protein
MDTMTYYLSEAEITARHLVATVEKSSGACESCGKDSPVTFYLGTAFECANCFYDSVTYWEKREGTTSEAIFDGSPFPVDEFKWGGKEHGRIVARHHSTLVLALEEVKGVK